jgi:predicted phosphoadenosine phosphosulfate sulfurtransferase
VSLPATTFVATTLRVIEPKEQRATKMLRVRMTPDEWATFVARVKKAGVRMSEYARAKLLGTEDE